MPTERNVSNCHTKAAQFGFFFSCFPFLDLLPCHGQAAKTLGIAVNWIFGPSLATSNFWFTSLETVEKYRLRESHLLLFPQAPIQPRHLSATFPVSPALVFAVPICSHFLPLLGWIWQGLQCSFLQPIWFLGAAFTLQSWLALLIAQRQETGRAICWRCRD